MAPCQRLLVSVVAFCFYFIVFFCTFPLFFLSFSFTFVLDTVGHWTITTFFETSTVAFVHFVVCIGEPQQNNDWDRRLLARSADRAVQAAASAWRQTCDPGGATEKSSRLQIGCQAEG